MREVKRSASMARRRSFPSARICFCPAISASACGRMRAARGSPEWDSISFDAESLGVKRESMPESKIEDGREATEILWGDDLRCPEG